MYSCMCVCVCILRMSEMYTTCICSDVKLPAGDVSLIKMTCKEPISVRAFYIVLCRAVPCHAMPCRALPMLWCCALVEYTLWIHMPAAVFCLIVYQTEFRSARLYVEILSYARTSFCLWRIFMFFFFNIFFLCWCTTIMHRSENIYSFSYNGYFCLPFFLSLDGVWKLLEYWNN